MKLVLNNLKLISSFQPLVALKPTTSFLFDIFASDLDGDGTQEFLVAGRQENTSQANWTNSTVHIFHSTANGWEDVTTKWLPDNVIVGSEPNVLFGDFNNDGRKDFFIAGDTDTSYLPPSFLFLNTGTSFTKQTYDFKSWAHGSFVADMNKDGFWDVLTTDYGLRTGIGFGSASGISFKPQINKALWSASGICAADFLGNGTMTILASDIEGVKDTALFSWTLGPSGELLLTNISTLPLPRFELSKWSSYNFTPMSQEISHDIRIIPFDFSGDGLMDAIEISRPWITNGKWPEYSEIQFLLNKGGGKFEDVTESKLNNYNTSTPASYQPVFLDANADGRTDIFLSSQDWSAYNSTALLLQQANGSFSEFGREEFSALWLQAVQAVRDARPGKPVSSWIFNDWGNTMQLVTGVNGKTSVVGTVAFQDALGGMSEMVYSADFNLENVSQNENLTNTHFDDVWNGGLGSDTVLAIGEIKNYSVQKTSSGYLLVDRTGSDGSDKLTNIEAIRFSDKTINLTVQAKAASAPQADVTRLVELYTAFFNRVPDADGMSFWIDEMKSGKTVNQVAESFYNAGVNYSSLTGFTATMKNTDFINVIYKNVLGRKDGADAGGLSFWDGALISGQASRGTLVTNILDSAHTFKGDKTWGWVADLLDNKITVAKKFSIDMGLNYNTPEESITKGMAIASAITSTDTSAAVTLIGVTEANLHLG